MSTVLEKGNITVHTENIFPIIKKSIYSDREIFLRELISNAVDAIAKLKMVSSLHRSRVYRRWNGRHKSSSSQRSNRPQ